METVLAKCPTRPNSKRLAAASLSRRRRWQTEAAGGRSIVPTELELLGRGILLRGHSLELHRLRAHSDMVLPGVPVDRLRTHLAVPARGDDSCLASGRAASRSAPLALRALRALRQLWQGLGIGGGGFVHLPQRLLLRDPVWANCRSQPHRLSAAAPYLRLRCVPARRTPSPTHHLVGVLLCLSSGPVLAAVPTDVVAWNPSSRGSVVRPTGRLGGDGGRKTTLQWVEVERRIASLLALREGAGEIIDEHACGRVAECRVINALASN